MRILVIEDDAETSDYVFRRLTEEGHLVERASTGVDALIMATSEEFGVLVVDRMIPGIDGLTVVKTLRSMGNQTPVLFLTTLDGVSDRITGLKAGGDDYLIKPFAFAELSARIASVGRRPAITSAWTKLQVADLELDLLSHTVKRGGRQIELQSRDFRLLECLMRHAEQVVTRTMLFERVWDIHFDPRSNVVDMHVSRLRGKLNSGSEIDLIHTVRGVGYSIRARG